MYRLSVTPYTWQSVCFPLIEKAPWKDKEEPYISYWQDASDGIELQRERERGVSFRFRGLELPIGESRVLCEVVLQIVWPA